MQLALILSTALALSPGPQEPPGAPVAWTVLAPRRVWSKRGTELKLGADHTVVVEGVPVPGDVHFVEFDTGETEITGFRLEVLGPGKGGGGKFRVGEIGVAAAPGRRKRLSRVVLVHAAGTSENVRHPVYLAIDNNTRSAWHGVQDNAVALFECAAPIRHEKGARLQFTFEYLGSGVDTLGEFRLSTTADPRPLRELGHPLAEWPKTQERINQAIDRGVQALLKQQERDGSWKNHQGRFPAGQTALSLYTLLKAGVSPTDDSVRRALGFLYAHPPERTYSLSLQVLALCALGLEEHRETIRESVDLLLSWQRRGFAYPEGAVDLSNTQYGALALREAARRGFKVPRSAWEGLVKQTLRHQQVRSLARTGPLSFPLGFSYRPAQEPTGSMTSAGVTILAICAEQMPKASPSVKEGIDRGLAWLAYYYSPSINAVAREPLEHHPNKGRLHYYLYGLERVAGLLDQNLLGPHDWYRKGALFLVDSQDDHGRWGNDQTNTCFGVLFLVRATRHAVRGPTTGVVSVKLGVTWGRDDPAAPVSIRAGGNVPLTVWVSSYGTETRAVREWPRERGPRVVVVKYFAAPAAQRDKKVLIATVEGDPSEPAEKKTFAAMHEFAEFGYHVLTAEVTVVPPPAGEGEPEPEPVVLKAPAVEVLVRDPKADLRPEELRSYARDPVHNLLADLKVKAKASSERGAGFAAGLAADNLHARGWMSEKDDARPWIRLDLSKAVRADLVLLSPIHDFTAVRPSTTVAFERVRLLINGRTYDGTMEKDPRRKTRLELPRPTVIRQLRIEILDRKHQDVGLAEIELQLRKDRK